MTTATTAPSLPPGPGQPSAFQFAATWLRPGAALGGLRRRYGPRFTVKLPFSPPFVMLSDPNEIRELLQAPPELVHPGEGGRILEPVVGPWSLLMLDEDAHLEHRRLLLPAFHGSRLKLLSGLMTDLTERELDGWPTGEAVALHPHLQRLTLEIILQAVFGLKQGERLDELRAAVTGVLAISESPVSLTLPTFQRWTPWLPVIRRLRRLLARTDELILAQVRERREAFDQSDVGDVAPDVLAMLLAGRHEDGEPMSERELRDELMTALVAGHETTASQLAWLFMQLAREPGVVNRLTAELDAGKEDTYLTATIHEIQRLRPVLPNAMPRLTTRDIRIGDWEYPAGTALLVSSWLIHHDQQLYPEPYAFRPERFVGVAPGTYTWLPFGGGRRRCIGAAFAQQEMKIVVAAVLRRFTISADRPEFERTARRSITFSPARGASVILTPREPSG
jgi:cytochrome P450